MNKIAITAARHALGAAAAILSFVAVSAQEPADYVDPFIGTNGMGHTFPGHASPSVRCSSAPTPTPYPIT